MISFVLIAQWFSYSNSSFNAVLASAFFMLLYHPLLLMDLGFQLSYLAVLGIILLLPIFKMIIRSRIPLVNAVGNIMLVSISAQVFTTPFVLYYFGQFPNYFLIANLLIVVPTMFIMYTGIVLAISPIHGLNLVLARLLDASIQLMTSLLEQIDRLPFSVTEGIRFDCLELVWVMACIIGVIWLCYTFSRVLFYCTIILVWAFIAWRIWLSSPLVHTEQVKFYNVKNEIAIAAFYKEVTFVFSTLDSLQHSILKYNIWNDLRQYGRIEHVQFIYIDATKGQDLCIHMNNHHIFIRQSSNSFLPYPGSLVLVRNNRSVPPVHRAKMLLLDASNTDAYIRQIAHRLAADNASIYTLKNNFAYVWH